MTPQDLPLPQRLALAYAPRRARAQCEALLLLDERLAAVVRGRREPIASQLRLAWWRERLAEPKTARPRGEPVLEALQSWRDPAPLSELPDAWEVLLADALSSADVAAFASGRAAAWAALAAEVRAPVPAEAELAGRWWAAGDLAANVSSETERALVVAYAATLRPPPRLPRALRTLSVLAVLGRAALGQGGTQLLSGPGALLRALRTGLTGL